MLLFVLCGTFVNAQKLGQGTHYVHAEIDLKAYEFKGNYVIINYEIPYSGMVEIRLFNPDGDKIWQNQYPHKFGENKIVLRLSAFEPGSTYAYVLNYKRSEIRDRLVIPHL